MRQWRWAKRQRYQLKNEKCNGEIAEALDYAKKIKKHAQGLYQSSRRNQFVAMKYKLTKTKRRKKKMEFSQKLVVLSWAVTVVWIFFIIYTCVL